MPDAPPEPTYVYAIVYESGVLMQTGYLYLTFDSAQAIDYSTRVYPGSIVLKIEQYIPGGV